MIIRIEELKDVCSKILFAIDASGISKVSDPLELIAHNGTLKMRVANSLYFVESQFNVDPEDELHATVSATLFTKLISQVTTESVELSVVGNALVVKANGTYKLPLIYDDDELLEVNEIKLNNVTTTLSVDSEILKSIQAVNSRETASVPKYMAAMRPETTMYYVDNNGCITFTSYTACINSFLLDQPIKLVLNDKIVKLFKLFKSGVVVVKLANDENENGDIDTKVKFSNGVTSLVSVISSEYKCLASFPVTAARRMANGEGLRSISINKDALIQAVARIKLFAPNENALLYGKLSFNQERVNVSDSDGENVESVYYNGTSNEPFEYVTDIDLGNLSSILSTCTEQFVNLYFGNSKSIVISRGNVKNVLSEIHKRS